MDALAGRLRITLPNDAVSSARPHDLMAAPTGDDQETRFVLDRQDARLVVLVSETFASPTDDLVATAAAFESRRIEAGTVVRQRILTSLAAGDARLELSGGTRVLVGGIAIDLPARYVVAHDRGPDFDVFRIRPIRRLGEDAGVLGVYVGHHPSFDPSGTESPGTLFGEVVTFYTAMDSNVVSREAIVEVPGARGTAVHVFIEGPDEQAVDALTAVASTLRVAPSPDASSISPGQRAPGAWAALQSRPARNP